MSNFDGTKLPLAYADALCEIAVRIPFGTEAQRDEVVKAIRVEHGVYVVPEAETRAAEIERLRGLVAAKEAEEKEAADIAEEAELRVKLGLPAKKVAEDDRDDPETRALREALATGATTPAGS